MKKRKQVRETEFAKLKEKVAVVWTRVSTREQAENNNSLDTQRKMCEDYAKRNNIRIINYYGGTYESAKTEGRLYQQMITDIAKKKEVNMILVAQLDRFSRAGIEAMTTRAYLKSQGIFVESAMNPVDHDSEMGDFFVNLLFLFNQFENNLRKSKCENGMRDCLRRGDWYSRPPLGYDKRQENGRHILTVNQTGELLRQAFTWKAYEGITDVQIAERLKGFGLSITKQRLSEIFHNPFYCGKIRHKFLDDDIIQGNQEPLVNEVLFNKVNGIESHNDYTHAVETPMYPLKRHIICADCADLREASDTRRRKARIHKIHHRGVKRIVGFLTWLSNKIKRHI